MNSEKQDEAVIGLPESDESAASIPNVISLLGELGEGAIITEDGIAQLFGRHAMSVKRAVERGELPPPTRLFNKNIWTVGALVRHIEKKLEEAARESERTNRKIAALSPR